MTSGRFYCSLTRSSLFLSIYINIYIRTRAFTSSCLFSFLLPNPVVFYILQDFQTRQTYEALNQMIVHHGQGKVLPENQSNLALVWGADVRAQLSAEETTARSLLARHDELLEEQLRAEMAAFDEARGNSNRNNSSSSTSGGGGGGGGSGDGKQDGAGSGRMNKAAGGKRRGGQQGGAPLPTPWWSREVITFTRERFACSSVYVYFLFSLSGIVSDCC